MGADTWDYYCFTCKAPKGSPCRTLSTGKPTTLHMSRIWQSESEREWALRGQRVSPNTPV